MMKKISSKRILIFIIFLGFYFSFGFFYKSHLLSSRFVDEEYNFAIGKYLLKNEILYKDILTNHQPLTHILSALVQNISKPDNTFFMVKYHRLFILIWSFAWSTLLVYYFGLAALIFIIFYTLTNSFIFGNLFLAEAIIVYPLCFLTGLILYKKTYLSISELLLGSLSLSLSGFLFGPVLPLLFFLIFLIIFKDKANFRKKIFFMLLGGIPIIILVLKFSSIPGYINYYFYTNLVYTIPQYHSSYYNEPWILTISKSLITPVLGLLASGFNTTLTVIKFFSIALLMNLGYLIFTKRLKESLIIFTLLALANLRFVYPGNEHYAAGFLPWYSLFIFICCFLFMKILHSKGIFLLKIINISIFTLTFILTLKNILPALMAKGDISLNYQTNYSTQSDRAEIIKLLKDKNDTLFTSPDNWIVYWGSDINHLPQLFGYYPWLSGITEVHQNILNQFENNPPAFFYCENCKGLDLEKYLYKYHNLKIDGKDTYLYILRSKIESLSNMEKDKLNNLKLLFD